MTTLPTSYTCIVLTGPSGCGKTALCLRAAEAARAKGLVVRGLVSPARVVDGVKVGIDVLDLAGDERRRLAEVAPPTSSPATMHWRFDADALSWGMSVLRHAVPCDLLVVDELGPLELVRGEGWVGAMDILRSGAYHWALVVVRPALVQRFINLVLTRQPLVIQASLDDQNRLLEQISGLWGDGHAGG